MVGDSTRFTRQDGVEETWRIMQPLIDARRPCTPTSRGRWDRLRPTSSSPGTAAGTSPGFD
jgi:glucose-6-phosphate 1-dehydrogenase